jgi:hypothetical protein
MEGFPCEADFCSRNHEITYFYKTSQVSLMYLQEPTSSTLK